MIRKLLIWVAFMWPFLANAAPLTVQTGEHDTFTRVVITIPEESEWQLGRQSGGYRLQAATREGFALDSFYDLIPRSRILEVNQNAESGELFFRVECNCNAEASVLQSRFLVVDFLDGAPLESSIFEVAATEAIAEVQEAPTDVPDATLFRPSPDRLLPLITPRFQAENEDDAANPPSSDAQDAVKAEETTRENATQQALQTFEQSLTASLGRGLSQGFLAQEQDLTGADAVRQTLADSFDSLGVQPFPGLDTQSALDQLAVMPLAPALETQVGQACLPPEAFDIADWGNEKPPYQQLSAARRILIDEADKIQEEGTLHLARLYVFLGFGREAQQVLGSDGAQSRERMIIRAIAQIIDGEVGSYPFLSGQVSCPTNVALWALLAQESTPFDGQVDRMAVINAFRELSPYVQNAVGPRLTEALLLIGAQDEALQILGRDLPDDRANVDLALAGAALAGALGEDVQSIEIISDVARNANRATPDAMTRFFREGIQNQIMFTDEDFLLADALRFEIGQSLAGSALADAQFEAFLFADRFEEARALLDMRRSALPSASANEAATLLIGQATARLSDAAFLEFIWEETVDGKNTDVRNLVAQRLLELGFPDRASDWALLVGDVDLLEQTVAGDASARQEIMAPRSDEFEASLRSITRNISVGPDTSGPSLQSSRALVESAAQSRSAIEALLQDNPAPAEF